MRLALHGVSWAFKDYRWARVSKKKKLEKSKTKLYSHFGKPGTCKEAAERGEQRVPPLHDPEAGARAAASAPQKGHGSRDQAGPASCGGEEEERNEGLGGPGLERKGSAGNTVVRRWPPAWGDPPGMSAAGEGASSGLIWGEAGAEGPSRPTRGACARCTAGLWEWRHALAVGNVHFGQWNHSPRSIDVHRPGFPSKMFQLVIKTLSGTGGEKGKEERSKFQCF